MTDHLERLIQSSGGQGPSEEFVARLRAKIVAATESPAVTTITVDRPDTDFIPSLADEPRTRDEIGELLVLEPAPAEQNPRRWFPLVGVAAAVAAVLFIGVLALSSVDDGDDRQLDVVDEPETPAGEVTQLTAADVFFDTGTFRIDTLGTAFTFEIGGTTGLLVNENGVVSITELTNRNADDRTLTFRRTSLLPDPAAPTAVVDPASAWPANDLAGWIDALDDRVIASEPTITTLGGLDATFVEIEFACDGLNCTAGDLSTDPDHPYFTSGSQYRLWVVDQDEQDPIVVIVAIDDDGDTAFFDRADALLSSLKFESIKPNPVTRPPAGPSELTVFGGISLELPQEVVVIEPYVGFARLMPPGIAGDVEFLTRPLDVDGAGVMTSQQLVELFEDESIVLTEFVTPDIGGIDARAFEVVSGSNPNVVLKARDADLVRPEFGWEPPHRGQLWVIEHPERGLLIVSAASFSSETIDELRTWTQALLRSLEFREA